MKPFPMFTSCCPGWVRFVKSQYPDMVDQLSTAKSPQQMFGAIAKTYYAKLLGVDPAKSVLRLHHAVRGQETRMRAGP